MSTDWHPPESGKTYIVVGREAFPAQWRAAIDALPPHSVKSLSEISSRETASKVLEFWIGRPLDEKESVQVSSFSFSKTVFLSEHGCSDTVLKERIHQARVIGAQQIFSDLPLIPAGLSDEDLGFYREKMLFLPGIYSPRKDEPWAKPMGRFTHLIILADQNPDEANQTLLILIKSVWEVETIQWINLVDQPFASGLLEREACVFGLLLKSRSLARYYRSLFSDFGVAHFDIPFSHNSLLADGFKDLIWGTGIATRNTAVAYDPGGPTRMRELARKLLLIRRSFDDPGALEFSERIRLSPEEFIGLTDVLKDFLHDPQQLNDAAISSATQLWMQYVSVARSLDTSLRDLFDAFENALNSNFKDTQQIEHLDRLDWPFTDIFECLEFVSRVCREHSSFKLTDLETMQWIRKFSFTVNAIIQKRTGLAHRVIRILSDILINLCMVDRDLSNFQRRYCLSIAASWIPLNSEPSTEAKLHHETIKAKCSICFQLNDRGCVPIDFPSSKLAFHEIPTMLVQLAEMNGPCNPNDLAKVRQSLTS